MITVHNSNGTVESLTRAECIARGYKIDLTRSEIVALHNATIRKLARTESASREKIAALQAEVRCACGQLETISSRATKAETEIAANLEYIAALKTDRLKAEVETASACAEIADLNITLTRAQAQITAHLQYQKRIEDDKRNQAAEIARLEGGLKIADAQRENSEALAKIKARTAQTMEKRISVLKTTIESMDRSNVILRETMDLLRSRKGQK